jgi:hypothetical protein
LSVATNQTAVPEQASHPNPRPDIAFVFGIQDPITTLGERLCKEFGLRVHRAMKRANPSLPIESLDEDAVIVPELGDTDTVHVCGFKVSAPLADFDAGPVECNWTDNDGTAVAYPLTCILLGASDGSIPLPSGWVLRDIPEAPSPLYAMSDERRLRQWQESECQRRRVGHFGPSGTVVADFGKGKQLLEIPAAYSQAFPLLENRQFF